MRVNGPYVHSTGELKGRRYVNITRDDRSRTTQLYSNYLMEQKLGRKLDFDETVDHIDNDPTNDNLSNLQILSRSANAAKWHVDTGNTIEYVMLDCLHCGEEFQKEARNERRRIKQNKRGPYCGKSCAGKASHEY
jgi:hypothetical protein